VLGVRGIPSTFTCAACESALVNHVQPAGSILFRAAVVEVKGMRGYHEEGFSHGCRGCHLETKTSMLSMQMGFWQMTPVAFSPYGNAKVSSPLQTGSTVPVSFADQSLDTSTSISPPGIRTVTGLSHRSVRIAAPAAAQLDVPDASV